ncbi:hypothetical protein QPK87_38110 [Kamptonema cortianum]|nr:hypothetical protein [Kamptonema cortianum]MDL5049732.1 hypothetical protein [Oscillatoria amoena NRMC-F 0135]
MNRSLRHLPKLLIAAVLLAGVVALVMLMLRKTHPPIPLEPFASTGGEYFPQRIINDVPQFFQDDPAWYHDEIGQSGSRMGPEGCAVAAAAMALAAMGYDTDPGRLNAYLSSTPGGYTERGWIYWEVASDKEPGKAEKVYEDIGDHALIDRSLKKGLTPIIKIFLPNGISHFVVVVGKEKNRYLIRDPSSRIDGRIVFLDDVHPTTLIHGVRLYDRK